jgi:hypothetical protein
MGIATVMSTLGDAYPALDREVAAHIGPAAMCTKGSRVNGPVLRQVYLAWLDVHPEQKQDPVGSAAMYAFRETWPCKEPK